MPLINAPVTFVATQGGGVVVASTNAAPGGTLPGSPVSLRTDTNGQAAVWLLLASAGAGTNTVAVAAYSGTNTAQTNFSEFCGGPVPMLALGQQRAMELPGPA